MRRLFIRRRIGKALKATVEPAHDIFKNLHAALQIEDGACVRGKNIIEICQGLFLESHLGFKLDMNMIAIINSHDAFSQNSRNPLPALSALFSCTLPVRHPDSSLLGIRLLPVEDACVANHADYFRIRLRRKFRRGRLLLLPLLEADEPDLDQLVMQESFANRLEHSGRQSLFTNQDDRLAVVEG